jgi:hypothetical protein
MALEGVEKERKEERRVCYPQYKPCAKPREQSFAFFKQKSVYEALAK